MSILTFLQENSFFWISISWLIITYLLWTFYRKNYPEKNSFDITIIGTLIVLFLHRFLYVLIFSREYLSNYWSWNLIAWVDGKKMFLGSKPWVIFAFWYKGFDFGILIVCTILIIFIISKLQQNLFRRIINDISRIVLLYYPGFLVATYFQNILVGNNSNLFFAIPFFSAEGLRHPVQIYLLIIWSVILYLKNALTKKYKWFENIDGLISFAVLIAVSSFVLQYFAYNVTDFVLNWLRIISIVGISFSAVVVPLEKFVVKKEVVDVPSQISRFTPFNSSNLNKNQNRWTKRK